MFCSPRYVHLELGAGGIEGFGRFKNIVRKCKFLKWKKFERSVDLAKLMG